MAVLGLLAACSSDPHITLDGSPPAVPFTYELGVFQREAPRADPATIYIDGVATSTISTGYPNASFADGVMHLVELRYADQVIASYPVTVHTAPPFCTQGPLAKQSEGVEELDSGDLRMGGLFEYSSAGNCHGDPAPFPHCQCSTAERCGLRVMRDEPLFTHLGCTPIGTKQVGEACSLTPDPDGAYDDCADNLICYQGTCHAPCNTTGCTTSCVQPEGYPNEAAICM